MSIPPIDYSGPSPFVIPGGLSGVNTPLQDVLTPDVYASLFSTEATSFLPPSDITLAAFFSELSKLKTLLSHLLKAGEIADRGGNEGIIQGMLDQAEALVTLYNTMHTAIRNIQQLVESVTASTNNLNNAITNFNNSVAKNNGDSIGTVNQAISSFNQTANQVNAVLGSSTATDEEKIAARDLYNQKVVELNGKLATFNNQIANSDSAAYAYTAVANAYLTSANSNNTFIDLFNTRSPVVKLDHQPTNITQVQNFGTGSMPLANTVSGIPSSVPTYGGNPFAHLPVYGFFPISQVTIPTSLLALNAVKVFLDIFAPQVLPLFNLLLWGDTTLEAIDDLNDKQWDDPNVEAYAPVPLAYFEAYSSKPGGVNVSAAGGITSAATIAEFGSGHVAKAMNKAGLSAIIQKADPDLPEVALQELIKLLLMLIAGLLMGAAKGAIPGALGTITPSLASLSPPPNSPTLVVVSALSLLNRNIEIVQSNKVKELVTNLVDKNPSFANLTESQKNDLISQLSGALSLTLLLVSGKILIEALGLTPNFLEKLLQDIPELKPEVEKVLATPVPPEKESEPQKILSDLEKIFTSEGYSPEKAKFLASVGLANIQNSFLAPKATIITPQTVNFDLFKDSFTGQLLLNKDLNLNIPDAKNLADNIINQALTDSDSPKAPRIRDEIAGILIQQGVNSREAQIIVSNLLIVPNAIPKEAFVKEGQRTPPVGEPLVGQLPPTDSQLLKILETRAGELLGPELGPQLTKSLTQDIVESLSGLSTDSNKVVETALEKPNSFVRLVMESVRDIKIDNEEVHNEAVYEVVKQFLKPLEDPNVALEKFLNPTYFFLAAVGIMYGQTKTQFSVGQGRSSGVDIPI